MIELTTSHVQIRASARTKEEAIRKAGQLLVENGNIEPGYIESMLGREQQANTYLGNGIAIPHGMPKDRELIQQTGIVVVQFPHGVTWNDGEVVYLVVGIAAKSDEHLGILARLTDILDDNATSMRLARTEDANDIITRLSQTPDIGNGVIPPADDWPDALTIDVTLPPGHGLHARPATFFVEVASEFQADIRVQADGKSANGKAMASLLKLGAEGGSVLRLLARGGDADPALQALKEAVEQGLGDEPEIEADETTMIWKPEREIAAITGVAAAPGLAIGKLHMFQASRIVVRDHPQDARHEQQQLHHALATAREQLNEVYESVKTSAGRSEAAIFRAHRALLDDPDLIEQVHGLIEAEHSAAWSWQQAITERVAALQQVRDERLAGRAADLNDVGQRVLRLLADVDQEEASMPDEPVILLAADLLPSDTARLDPKRTLGLCTAAGGPTSHTAIIARSLGIPATVGAGALLLEQTSGSTAILDGSAGKLYLEPTEAELQSARQFQCELAQQRDAEYRDRYQPALMSDGYRVEVVANITRVAEAQQAVEAGAEGIGLMRTEFLYLERATPPTEDEQYTVYAKMIQALNGLPLIIRTLDIGGDKAVPYLDLPAEDNPFLGVRGIRLCLRRPDLFRSQLRAIYRAAQTGPVKIMFPMIATLEEFREAKAIAEEVRLEIGASVVEIGIMVEVPSTVWLAREFAQEVDFFSIGTNDLTQYALAIDRLHPTLARYVDGLHPAVLRMIDQTVAAAYEAGKWVGVCGGIAGDPRGAIILAGLGVSELSMSIPSVAAVKARLRQISFTRAQEIARQALNCSTATEVRQLTLV
ncbi:MAG: phosphoenolpyruvate--protein phosphotransferase [Chloroflexaceae bacterium]|nr:phosphoenolpyruvate--protein phosphotransferase [Chloroflexaceae bacterium]